MAPYAVAITSLLCIYSPVILSLRYGSRSQTLHIPEVNDEQYYGKGFQTIVRDENVENSPISSRTKRAADNGPDSSNIVHMAHLNDSHYQMIVQWAGQGSDVIVALTKDIKPNENSTSNVYISNDYGQSFTLVQALDHATVYKYYNSPVLNSFYVFTDILHNMIYLSNDYVKTFQRISMLFTPRQLSLHPTDASVMLAYDEEDHEKRLWLSRNSGRIWEKIQVEVKSFFWGNTTEDMQNTLYVERLNPFTDTGSIIKTDDFFETSTVLAQDVVDFQMIKDYMFVSKKLAGNHVELWVSYKRNAFHRADFPYNNTHQDYYVADAAEDRVFLCVFHNKSTTHLYVSDISGLHYTLSLRNVVYFNLKFRNDSAISLLREKPFADIYRVDGLQGFYIASQFHSSVFSLRNQTSYITFDKGATWQAIQAPDFDAYGNSTHCSHFSFYKGGLMPPVVCSLHLAQNFHLFHPQARTAPILSKKSAIGLVMATGTLGSTIGSEMNVYVSNDGGTMWREAFKGTHYYAFGDYGGVIVAVRQLYLTGEIFYSVNEGETWHSVEFSKTKVLVYGLLSEPGEKTTIFSVFGSFPNTHQWIIIKIDLKSVFSAQCVREDYKKWSPSESYKVQCLLGQDVIYSRRRAHADCYNGGQFEREISFHNCTCSEMDYECDEGFRKKYTWGRTCEIDPDSTISINAIPRPCPEGTYYLRTKGYRRIAGDKCHGGVETRLEPDRLVCPIREQDEFILFTTRRNIHRRLFTHGQDYIYPLSGLQDVVAVEFDYQQNCMYWADMGLNVIQKLCMFSNSSRQRTTIISDKIGTVESLALDWMSNILYWVDSGNATIEMCHTDGTHRRLLLNNRTVLDDHSTLSIVTPRSLVVYPKYGLMYWSDWSDDPKIMSSYMDGKHIRTLVTGYRLRWPNGLTIDDLNERLYWADAGSHGIYSVDLHGGNFQVLLENPIWLPHPYAIAIYKSDIYWTDWSREAILMTSLQHHNQIHTVVYNISWIMDMKIMHYASQQGAEGSPCFRNNGECRSICVERPFNTTTFTPLNRTCLCADSYQKLIQSDGTEQCGCEPGEVFGPNDSCIPGDGNQTCAHDQFPCKSGKCIPLTWKCDRDHDCGLSDDSDEWDCAYETCTSGMFTCNNNKCIPMSWKCDHDRDCGNDDSSDEPDNCVFESCAPDMFACNNGLCVSESWRCDGDDDCHDGSDENATFCMNYTGNQTTIHSSNTTCNLTDEFQCENYRCIPSLWHCDGVDDCNDNSDELECGTNGTDCDEPWLYTCQEGFCIERAWYCDGAEDCPYGDDEKNCVGSTLLPTPSVTAPSCKDFFTFNCGNTVCVSTIEVCDGVNDCGNNADEDICGYLTTTPPHASTRYPTTTSWSCQSQNDFMCSDGDCIHSAWVCDGYNDCKLGDDEIKCNTTSSCSSKYFKCRFAVGCIPANFVCDGDYDCSDHSDELDCNNRNGTIVPHKCHSSEFLCDNTCLSRRMLCDGHRDCFDGQDEAKCAKYRFSSYLIRSKQPKSVSVVWGLVRPKPPSGAKVRVMHRKSEGNFQWVNETAEINDNQYVLKNLSPGTQYDFTVALSINNTVANIMPVKTFVTSETAPEAPENLHLNVQPNTKGRPLLVVTWEAPTVSNGWIRNYTVFACQLRNAVCAGYPIQQHVKASEKHQVEYDEFFGGSVISVWVTATNIMEGAACQAKNITMIVPNRPHCTQPGRVAGVITYTDAVTIQWKYVGNITLDHIDAFKLVFVPKSTLGVNITLDVNVKDIHKLDASYTTSVSGWSPGLTYLGYVLAHNGSGYGQTCFNQVIMITVPGQSLEPPSFKSFTQDPMTHQLTIRVSVPAKPEWYNATQWLPESMLFYSPKPESLFSLDDTSTDIQSVVVPNDGVVQLDGLLACNEYTFRAQVVKPITSRLGPISRHITEIDSKAPPKDVAVYILDNYTDSKANINVSLTTPCQLGIKGLSQSYIIRIEELWPNSTVRVVHGFPFSSTQPQVSHVVKSLHRGATYAVSVSMDEMDTKQSQAVTLLIRPHRAPSHFSMFPNMEDGLLFLRWKAPKPSPKTDNFTYGIYHALGDDNYTLTAHVGHDENSYIAINLEPATVHKFKVRIDNIYGYSGEFTPVETFTTPSKEKWVSYMAPTASPSGLSASMLSAIIVPCVVIVVILATALAVYVMRHHRLQRSFLSYANSHYDTRSGTARFGTSDDLEEESQPMIQGFSDDEPLIVA